MVRKSIGLLIICLLLCGCKEALGPDMQLDSALTDIEVLNEMKTTLTLKDPSGEVLAKIETETKNIQDEPVLDMMVNGESKVISADEPLAKLCRFALVGNSFLNFSRAEDPYGDTIGFEIGSEDYQALSQALGEWMPSPFQKVTGTMNLNEADALQKMTYQIETSQGTYQFELLLEE